MVLQAVSLPTGSTRTGIACMITAAALLTMNDAVVKLVTDQLPVGQVLFLRGLVALIPISFVVWRNGGMPALRVRDPRNQLLRSVMFTAATFFMVGGLAYLPLPLVVFISAASPLFVTALAPVILGERVGWRRWTAVVVGLCGVLMITSPAGHANIGWTVLLPLGAAVTSALADLVTRKMSATESSTAIVVCSTTAIILGGLSTWPLGWVTPDLQTLLLVLLGGLLQGTGFLFLVESFRHGEATVVAPFRYTILLWGLLLGIVIWGEVPGWNALGGALIILVAAVYVYHREAVLVRR